MSFLDDYEPVETRLAKFWADNPTGRVTTEMVATEPVIVFRSELYRDGEERPYATGHAHQRRLTEAPKGRQGRPNDSAPEWTSPYEVCETSAVGRALANAGYAPKGKRPSREEISQSERNVPPPEPTATNEAIEPLVARVQALPDDTAKAFSAWKDDQGFPWPWPASAVEAMHAELDRIESTSLPPATDEERLASEPCAACGSERATKVLAGDGTVLCADRPGCEKRVRDLEAPM